MSYRLHEFIILMGTTLYITAYTFNNKHTHSTKYKHSLLEHFSCTKYKHDLPIKTLLVPLLLY
jgi:hypothetical protein